MYLQGQSIFLLKKKKKADLTEKEFLHDVSPRDSH